MDLLCSTGKAPLRNAMRADSLTDAQRQRFSQLVSEGEILSPVEFQRRMGWSAEDVTLAELARRVFALESDNAKAYPAFYSDPRYAREQLEAITIALGDLPGVAKDPFGVVKKTHLLPPERSPSATVIASSCSRAYLGSL